MTREQLEFLVLTSPSPHGRCPQRMRLYGIEDYLFIGADRMSARAAAARLGVSKRTIERYRAVLRSAALTEVTP